MEALSSWFALHPHLAGLTVFLIALAESLAVVGLLVPGVAMMFAAGALVGSGALSFGPVCAWAIAGATAGDGISFWLGRHFRGRLPDLRPFRSHPEMFRRGEAFFHRYGGRSIVFGRFVGPVRAVIPLIAGTLGMPAGRFLLVNVLSAVLWAPAYLLPGMAFGASLDVASQVTGRLVTLLVLVLTGLWFTAWCTKHLYRFLQPRAHALVLLTFDLCKHHPLVGRLAAPLIDPAQRDYPGLIVWAMILLGVCLLLAPIIGLDRPPVSLQALRSPWSDHAFTMIEALGKGPALAALGTLVALRLAIEQQPIALAHWLAALCFAVGLEAATRAMMGSVSPIDSTTLTGTVSYGFLAVLLADGFELAPWRWLIFTIGAVLAGTLAFSRLYLGLAALSNVAFTGFVALTWLSLLGVAYRRHREQRAPARGLVGIAIAVLATVLLIESRTHSIADFEHPPPHQTLVKEAWLAGGWIALPDHRTRLFGAPTQEFQIQWAASLSEVRRTLTAAGWQQATPLTFSSALNGLNPASSPDQLPVLPHFNQGLIDQLRMTRHGPDGRWLILRFWNSGAHLQHSAEPIWLASCGQLAVRQLVWTAQYTRQQKVAPATIGETAREIVEANPDYQVIPLAARDRSAWLLSAPPSLDEPVPRE